VYTNAHGSFTQTGNGEALLMGEAAYGTPVAGFMGLRADLVAWPLTGGWGALGVEVRARGQAELFKVVDSAFTRVPLEASGGLRYGFDLGVLRVGASVGAHYLGGALFAFEDEDRTVPGAVGTPILGLRVGPSLQVDTGKVYVNAEFAQTVAASAANSHLDGLVEVALTDAIGLRVGAFWDLRSLSYATEDGVGQAEVDQSQVVVMLGAGFRY
jgi:hypothetical protein